MAFPLIVLLALFAFLQADETANFPSNPKIKARYATIDPKSVSQNFAFYELFPETKEGRLALERAWKLLNASDLVENYGSSFPMVDLQPLINLVNRQDPDPPKLTEEQLALIDTLAQNLHNRKLKGYGIWDIQQVLQMDPEEIDLCRGLFLAEHGESEEARKLIHFYEASIDLMALQILAHLSPNATSLEKIRAINDFIFHEMRFRFPPHSLWAKDIDIYTFLPSVIDSRRGVCLGVSILYLCIAQRLNLKLEAITPPGHIYVRYREKDQEELNIETTARGIHVPSEMYLGMEIRKLQMRNNREVIGLAFINQASVSWMKKDYQTAISLYEKALPFMPNDYLLEELLGYNYLFVGREEEGRKLLQKGKDVLPEQAVTKNTIAQDYLAGLVSPEGIKAIFMEVDETRASIIEKQKTLQEITQKYPKFRAGLLSLAGTWLQLGREKEALKILKTYFEIDAKDPVVNYYLAALFMERFDFNQAWKHLTIAEEIAAKRSHHPHALKELRRALLTACPEPKL